MYDLFLPPGIKGLRKLGVVPSTKQNWLQSVYTLLKVTWFPTFLILSNGLLHCVKSVQIRSYFWSVFSRMRTEYREILCTRNNSIFGHFPRSAYALLNPFHPNVPFLISLLIHLWCSDASRGDQKGKLGKKGLILPAHITNSKCYKNNLHIIFSRRLCNKAIKITLRSYFWGNYVIKHFSSVKHKTFHFYA